MLLPSAAAARPTTRRNPLRIYQFRVGLLPSPADPESRAFFADAGGSVQAGGALGTPTDYVAGVRKVSGLTVTVAPSEVREGGNSLHRYANPDRATWDPITLEQGLAIDDTLERWAGAVVGFLRTGTVDPAEPVKRNLFIDVWDPALPADARVRRYLVFNAWISRFQAIPQLDAMGDDVALLSVELVHEGWRQDAPPELATSTASATADQPEGGR